MPTQTTPAVKKAASKKKAATKTVKKSAAQPTASKAASPKKGNGGSSKTSPVSPEQRYQMICEAAYYIAEQRGFQGGNDTDDWLLAELQVDTLLTRHK